MAGGNPFMPPGAGLPAGMPGANPAGPVPGGPLAGSLSKGGFAPPGGDEDQPARGPAPPPGQNGQEQGGQRPPSLEQVGRMAQNQYKDGMRAQQVLDHLREELDQLMDHGDMIRPEQVIEAAGRLVGHGIGAAQLAQLMSDMPATGGEGLAGWIRMHDVTVTNAEQALMQENNLIRHRMGMVGMRMLAQQHVQSRVDMHLQGMQASMGPLSPGGGQAPTGGMGVPSNDLGAASGGSEGVDNA